MEQDSSQNQNPGFLRKNQTYLLIAGVIAVLIIVYWVSGPNEPPQGQIGSEEQTNEEMGAERDNEAAAGQAAGADQQNQTASADEDTEAGGVFSVTGILRGSDNQSRGNLMVDSDQGKVYVFTRRDFSAFLDKEVTLRAQGQIGSFVFLGFAEAGVVSGTDTSAVGGPSEDEEMSELKEDAQDGRDVRASGTLQQSDDQGKGNYLILTGDTKIYLRSARDYSAWIESAVELAASGTLQSFTDARLSKK